mgnify:CR=1 FL=1
MKTEIKSKLISNGDWNSLKKPCLSVWYDAGDSTEIVNLWLSDRFKDNSEVMLEIEKDQAIFLAKSIILMFD